ncbi:MAG TPA: PEP-utilizing enzyme [Acidimicrobiia bacterium]|nr:PEP-utilizing enzyme [Acidimicrobiia bacterium]
MSDRFPSPFEIETPPGAEGWEELYPYYTLFSADRREYEDSMFWFQDGIHWPEVLTPWDVTFFDYAIYALSQYNTRHYLIPPALGVDARILNGYAYLSPVGVADPAEVEARVPHFLERAGYYFGNWDRLYGQWMEKMRALIGEMEELSFEPLPEKEEIEVITEGHGTGSGLTLTTSYHRLCDLALKLWQYHFEFLNLGYAAYLDSFGFCKQAFPNIPDLSIAKMVAGVDVDLFRPDEELKGLARAAIELGVDKAFNRADDAEAVLAELGGSPAGQQWLERFEQAKHPWFNFSSGSGFYHTDRVWIEHLSIPFGFIGNYVAKLNAGDDIERPVEQIRAERDRIVAEYTELLGSDEDRAAFEGKLGLARTVFPYVENHNFYVEHWSHSVLWRKMRDLGRVLAKEGFLAEPDDIFYLKRNEIPDAITDYYGNWAVGVAPRGTAYWPREIERRKGIIEALRQWSPPKALGEPPEVVTEPFTIMLWGITSESVKAWLGGDTGDSSALSGFAASPGVAEGPARVIFSADQIGEVEDGDILVAPLTAPSWAPIFGKIGATVTDIGGMMSHAAIVCREYGLPAVTGTAFGTRQIKTGQRIRVDGSTGTVTVLEG